MKRNGHRGLNMLLIAPAVALLMGTQFFGPALILALLTVTLSSLPDADIDLAELSSDNSWLPGWIYSPLLILVGLALVLHNLAANTVLGRLSTIDRKSHTIQHRGITHTLWFGVATGIGLTLIAGFALAALLGAVIYTGVARPSISIDSARLIAYSAALVIGPVCAVVFHSAGDAVTPSGVGFTDPTASRSLDRFRYDNFLANNVASKFGLVTLPLAFIGGYAVAIEQLSAISLVSAFAVAYILFLPLWIWIPQTRVGGWITRLYKFLN